MKNNNIIHLDVASMKEALNGDVPTVVLFFNPSCYLCDGLRPIIEQLQQTYGNFYNFAKLNVVKHPRVAKVFNIDGVPEIYVIKKNYIFNIPYPDDEEMDVKSGYPKEYLIKHLNEIKNSLF